MADSLKYGGLELLSGAGGVYHISDGQRGLGDPQAVVQSIRAQLTMGSAVVGRFTDNRHVSLTVIVTAANRPSLSAACEALSFQVDQPVNSLVWTPNTGLPTVYDTWRGQVTTTWSGKWESGLARVMQVTFDALPFGRSDVRTVISGSSGTVALADFSTPSGFTYKTVSSSDGTLYPDLLADDATKVASVPMPTTGTNHAVVTASPSPYEGSGSTQTDANFYESQAGYSYTATTLSSGQSTGGTTTTFVPPRGVAATTISPSGAVALNLSATTKIVGALYSATYGTQAMYLKLTDSHGASQTFSMTFTGTTFQAGTWSAFSVNVAGSTLDLANITGWALTGAVGMNFNYSTGLASTPILFGELRAYPVSSSLVTTTNGGSFKLAGVLGSAQADATVALDRGGTNTMAGILAYRAPVGATVPAIVPLTGSPPSGSTVAPSLLTGTFRLIIAAGTAFTITTSSNIVLSQKINGVSVATKNLTPAVNSASSKWQDLGEVTLPLVDVPAQATGLTYSLSLASSGPTELLMIDTRGTLVWVPSFTAAKYVWIDEATAANGMGGVWSGAASDKSDAVSLLGATGLQIAGSFSLAPGDNILTVYCVDGLPNVSTSFYPRWLHERSA